MTSAYRYMGRIVLPWRMLDLRKMLKIKQRNERSFDDRTVDRRCSSCGEYFFVPRDSDAATQRDWQCGSCLNSQHGVV